MDTPEIDPGPLHPTSTVQAIAPPKSKEDEPRVTHLEHKQFLKYRFLFIVSIENYVFPVETINNQKHEVM